MLAVLRKIKKSLQECGVWGTVCHAVCSGRWRQARDAAIEAAIREFDLPYHVDTAGLIPLQELTIDGDNRKYGTRYEAVLPHEFHDMMRTAGDVARGRVFVDLGCGKGRSLLLASEYPFKRIVGVEFARETSDVARKNLLCYQNARQMCRDIEIVSGDATSYPLPNEPLVLFLFNPFVGPTMKKVVDNTRRSLERHPRPFTLLYSNPTQEKLWSAVPSLKMAAKAWRTSSYLGYIVYQYLG
jgi:SAM-dependent methyltransferase